MADYRVVLADLTGTHIDEVPANDLEYSFVRNGPGACSFKLPLRHEKATRAILEPGQRELKIIRDGVTAWGGYLWRARLTGLMMEFAGEGYLSRLRRRYISDDRSYTDEDQIDIAWALVDYTQTKSGGDLGIARGSTTASGVTRTVEFFGYEHKRLGEAIEQLAALEDGFDFEITPSKRFNTYYPRKGRRIADVVVDFDSNVLEPSYDLDALEVASEITVIGQDESDGAGGVQIQTATAQSPAAIARFRLLEDTRAYKDVREAAILTSTANEAVRLAGTARETAGVRFAPGFPRFGQVTVGDSIRVRMHEGYIDFDRELRIVELKVDVSDDGSELIVPTFEEEAV